MSDEEKTKVTRRSRRRAQPRFFDAVLADAHITSFYRGEHFDRSERLRSILRTIRLIWVSDGFLAQVIYRFGARMNGFGVPLVPRIARGVTMLIAQMSIDDSVIVRPGVSISHGQVTIGGLTEIRSGSLIAPFVSIGLIAGELRGPTIGNRSVIGTGARILGPIEVGAHARIGANAVVLIDVPEGGIAVGVPARILPRS